ncbi:sugar transferase [Arthrobacter sp. zg-Y1219]|uniref:sugar transferase n=1 Tax=Arthrobacter sp. zg-Y1219 TaxID=3049067 RepID=UPI0024C2F092|nr:sugar transferase [Arthrobacter sp. zg-Y1219]MDK1360183.1 sugar transferase [Arthrobacter sp. zg-Y1219]
MDDWRRKYTRKLAVVDAIVILWAMAGALIVRFAAPSGAAVFEQNNRYLVLTAILAASWWLSLGLMGSRDTTVLGHGADEYKRILSASFWVFGLVAVVSYALQLEIARGYVVIALPAGLLSLLAARTIVRSLLKSERRSGTSSSSVLLIGGVEGVAHLARALANEPMAGYRPVATYLPNATPDAVSATQIAGLPNLGIDPGHDAIKRAVASCQPDAVAFSSGVPLRPQTIRELGWTLAELNIKMIMAPALTDVAGPRIHTQPVAGLPLIHVSTPNLGNGQRLLKRSFDLAGAVLLLLVLSPVLLVIAGIVRFDSPGPVFFKQQRVGAGGHHFKMYKFRSMVVDAEVRLDALKSHSEGNGVMFKLKADPRITRVGSFLRRYSLDEFPQLFNVVNGTMSLVGPRPPLPSEVELYQRHVHRRLMVRPGLTGLWQVSGRSLLSWDDTVRLDLYYVENWSVAGDIAILLKTFRAVLARQGAY